jgi:putative cardiolipin synthase
VRVRILTNALEATDVAAVHAGYAKHRKALLASGVRLYELRRLSPQLDSYSDGGPIRSSGSSLHSKTFAVDGRSVFIGSFNFDPRSAKLNTEMGVVIESAALAKGIDEVFESRIPGAAYEVRLSNAGAVQWMERRDGAQVAYDREPGTSFWRRAAVRVMSLLPIDWLL